MGSVTHVGLDVHKDTIAVAVLLPHEQIPGDEHVIANTPQELRSLIRRLGDAPGLFACYEAGPTGYHTYRVLEQLGVACEVIAPSLIPRAPGARIKTDRLDARALARLHRAGQLTAIRVPTPAEEAVRDLIRVREDLKRDRRITQQRIRSFLLRHGRHPQGTGKGWSAAFERWARAQHFPEPAAEVAYGHLLVALVTRTDQLAGIEEEIGRAAELAPLRGPVARLRCLRGIGTLSAATIAAEVCDARRFPTAESFMAFTGLVPSEHSSGPRQRRGAITKAGNAHLRRVLVEAAWSYRHRPAVGQELARRQQGQPVQVSAYAMRAQQRLHRLFHRVADRRGSTKAAVATARELAGFCWGMMCDQT
jgi:transposase